MTIYIESNNQSNNIVNEHHVNSAIDRKEFSLLMSKEFIEPLPGPNFWAEQFFTSKGSSGNETNKSLMIQT